MATYTVSSTADSGVGSLREAIGLANGNAGMDIIDFSIGATATISLTSGELLVSDAVEIQGDVDSMTATAITIDAGGTSRVFNFSSGTSSVDNLIITGGSVVGDGGVITNSPVQDGPGGDAQGGGILNAGTLTITNSTITGNGAGAGGGGAPSAGGGGGFSGIAGSIGGDGANGGYGATGTAGAANAGGAGGDNGAGYANKDNTGGGGGTTSAGGAGGANAAPGGGGGAGGAGGTAGTAGGGGGAGGYTHAQDAGVGGSAGGGIWNAAGGTLTITDSTITNNLGAGGGGGGGGNNGGDGGDAAGGILNETGGLLTIDAATLANFSGNVGTAGAGGAGGSGSAGATGADENDILGAYTVTGAEMTFTVTTLTDEDNAGATVAVPLGTGLSLREAIGLANSGDTITFDNSLSGMTMTLGGTRVEIGTGANLTIDGDLDDNNTPDITISGNDVSQVFFVAGGANATFDGLIISNGYGVAFMSGNGVNGTNYGAGDSSAGGDGTTPGPGGYTGGGIANAGTLTVINSTLLNNYAKAGNGGNGGSGGSGGASLPNGNGYVGGAGGDGSSGGYAGSGILNLGSLTLTNVTATTNTAIGGNAGDGGDGGNGGDAQGTAMNGGAGGTGGNGGDGGAAAAIVNTGVISGTLAIVGGDSSTPGTTGSGGTGGDGGMGNTGAGGAGGSGGAADSTGSAGGAGSAVGGGTGGNGGDGGNSAPVGVGFVNVNGGTGTVTVTAPNQAPVISNLLNDMQTFSEGGMAVPIDFMSNAIVNDADSADFDGGSLMVQITGGGVPAEDELGIDTSGTVALGGTTVGSSVSVGGTQIGMLGSALDGSIIDIDFDADATPALVTTLLRAVTYDNSGGEMPTNGLRLVTTTLVDGDGTAMAGVDTVAVGSEVFVLEINDEPSGTDNTISIAEDGSHMFTLANFGFTDTDGDDLDAVIITTLPMPVEGTLELNNVAVVAMQEIDAADIMNGLLVFTPDAGESGDPYTSFTFQVKDDGGTPNGGEDTDQSPNTMTIDVTDQNDPPSVTLTPAAAQTIWDQAATSFTALGISNAVAAENFTLDFPVTLDLFTALIVDGAGNDNGVLDNFDGTFGWAIYQDDGMGEPGAFVISGNDAAPGLTDTGMTLFGTDDVIRADIDLGGVMLAAGDYWIALREGTWGSGVDATSVGWVSALIDPLPEFAGFTSNVTMPDGTFNPSLFRLAFSLDTTPMLIATEQVALDLKDVILVEDPDSGGSDITVMVSVDYGILNITPGASGAVVADSGTGAVTITGTVSEIQTMLASGGMNTVEFVANTDAPPATATLTVDVNDNGFTGAGGAMTDMADIVIGITPVNDAPDGTDGTVTAEEDATYAFALADFGFTDVDGHALSSVIIDTLPGAGLLELNGAAVSATDEIDAADIMNGLLTFTPALNENGAAYASFDFRVRDDGGTLNGGVDLDAAANTITIDVGAQNDAPAAPLLNMAITDEDTPTGAVPIGASDPDGDDLSYAIKPGFEPQHGSVSFAGGSFIYTPDPDANGDDMFAILIDDGNGEVAQQFVSVTINPVEDPPVAADDMVMAVEDIPLELNDLALIGNDHDADGDALTITAFMNASGGSVARVDGKIVFTPNPGFVGEAGFDYTVTDGNGNFDTAHVTVDVVPALDVPNEAPQVTPSSLFLSTIVGAPIEIMVDATDPEDDPLSFAAGLAANGDLTGGAGGAFVYTPDPEFSGTDSFEFIVSDDQGNETTQPVDVEVINIEATPQWLLLTTDGFAGAVGGMGKVFGAPGIQQITVLDLPGTIDFGPAFNAGGDIVTLPGISTDWSVVQQGANGVFSDGDTFVVLPAGPAGALIDFDDSTFVFSTDGANIEIGGQVLTGTMTTLNGLTDAAILPPDPDPSATGQLILYPGGSATAGGTINVFGTNGFEAVNLVSGDAIFDASFNRGGDMIGFDDPANDFSATRVGASVLLQGSDTTAEIPVGTDGSILSFDGDQRILAYDPGTDTLTIGGDIIDGVASPLSFA